MSVLMLSSSRTTSLQFLLSFYLYSVIDTACGGLIGKLHGFIQSPNYPRNYPNNREYV